MSEEREIKVKSLQKALEILGCFVEKQPLGVTEISEKLGLYKSNVHNILMTFKAMDYLEQDPETGKFSLGTAVFTLSRALKESLTISKVVLPICIRSQKRRESWYILPFPMKMRWSIWRQSIRKARCCPAGRSQGSAQKCTAPVWARSSFPR